MINPEANTYDLCIIGTGIAGLNALFVASRYLNENSRVLLVDRRQRSGGMWVDTYDYVRLHQPHSMFTAGDIRWTINQPPSYLATKQEVLTQFAHCLAELSKKLQITQWFEHELILHEESNDTRAYPVQVQIAPLDQPDKIRHVQVKRLIKAFGFHLRPSTALPLSSSSVNSVSPNDLTVLNEPMRTSNKPVWIVGGGKTGMDSAHSVISKYPGREVNLIVGKGTMFLNRDTAFPTGIRRWWAGHTGLNTFLDLALRFDGTNEREVAKHFGNTYGLQLGEDYQHYVFALLSKNELSKIASGVKRVIKDYLDDVVDTSDGPELRLRSGESYALEPGTLLINCTGSVMRDKSYPYEPYLSPGGHVLSVQPRSAIHMLTTFGSYFLTHLFYLDKLAALPLYEMDYVELYARNKVALPYAAMAHILHNTMLISSVVPERVFTECGLDFDRWFPMSRRLFDGLRMKRHGVEYLSHFRASLDRFAQTNQLRCRPLEYET